MAVLYVKHGQSHISDIWENKPPADSRFYKFMDSIATKIDMEKWQGYRGNFGSIGEDAKTTAYYKCAVAPRA